MRCKTCHYSLTGLTAHAGQYRCPECGRTFDPNDPSSFQSQRSGARPFVCLVAGATVYVIVTLYLFVTRYGYDAPAFPAIIQSAIAAVGPTLIIVLFTVLPYIVWHAWGSKA